jgi:hypothetical protein
LLVLRTVERKCQEEITEMVGYSVAQVEVFRVRFNVARRGCASRSSVVFKKDFTNLLKVLRGQGPLFCTVRCELVTTCALW